MARFDSLQFPVHRLKPDETVDQAFPQLFKKPEFKALKASKAHAGSYNRLVKYIVYLYDKNTDLTNEFRNNLQARKDAAAIEAGFERIKGDKWPEYVQKVMDIRDREAMEAIMAYLKHQRYETWTEICVTEQELDEFQKIRFQSVGKKAAKDQTAVIEAANKKDKLKESCDLRRKSLESLYNQFYEDHQELRHVEFTEMITPENAERILAAEQPPWQEIKS